MYSGGYTWTHTTDSLGFRNSRTLEKADILLLGDSFIYGHGAELDQTVGYHLERLTGLTVANLARQGDCSLQQSFLLQRHIARFRPRYVLYFYLISDVGDLFGYRTPAELAEFVKSPVESIRFPAPIDPDVAVSLREARLRGSQPSLFNRMRERLFVLKIPDWIEDGRAQRRRLLDQELIAQEEDEHSLGWQFTKKAILYMDHVARQHGAQLVIAPIALYRPLDYDILQRFGRQQGIPFVPTQAITDDPYGPYFLPNDGHFSPRGAEAMARLLADYLISLSRDSARAR
jgi:hypothetical protein